MPGHGLEDGQAQKVHAIPIRYRCDRKLIIGLSFLDGYAVNWDWNGPEIQDVGQDEQEDCAMLIREFVDEGLGNTSYLVASEETSLAAVIDPERDVDRYLQIAAGLGLRLRYALDTHLHNDFVSGVRELAAQAQVRVGASADAKLGFEHVPLAEGDSLTLGELTLGILATPGHTPEHISFTVATSKQAVPQAVFTGGALMVGGAARTDLLGPEWTVQLARQLYDSLHARLLKLPDRFGVIMQAAGLGDETAVVAYSERDHSGAARLWWALRYYGHAQVAVLDGGLSRWRAEGRSLETGDVVPNQSD